MMEPREYVSLAEVAKKWNRQEDELIDLAMKKIINLYCYKEYLPGVYRWILIRKELGCFLGGGNNGVTCQDIYSPIAPVNSDPMYTIHYTTPNYLFNVIPVRHPLDSVVAPDRSSSDRPLEMKLIVYRYNLHLHRDDITKVEKEHPAWVGEKIEKVAELKIEKEENSPISVNDKNKNLPREAGRIHKKIENTDLAIIGALVELLVREKVNPVLPFKYKYNLIDKLIEDEENEWISKETLEKRLPAARKDINYQEIKNADRRLVSVLYELLVQKEHVKKVHFKENNDLIAYLVELFKNKMLIGTEVLKKRIDKGIEKYNEFKKKPACR